MREFTDGSTAIVRGALDAGCNFFAGYPITPASPILMQMMRELPKVGGVAIQGEDEIASIGMCIGAALAGARAMTATSGPGFSLYSENIGLAIMGEVPLVIVDVQRLGPATGGATTVGPGRRAVRALGHRGRLPGHRPGAIVGGRVLHAHAPRLRPGRALPLPGPSLTDKELNMTTHHGRRRRATSADRCASAQRAAAAGRDRPYSLHAPPTSVPPHGAVRRRRRWCASPARPTTSARFITKEPDTVDALNEHLRAKIEDHADEIELVDADLRAGRDRRSSSATASPPVPCARRCATCARRGGKVSALTVQSLWPVPERAIRAALEGVERVVVAELNLGQYRREIERVRHRRGGRGPEPRRRRADHARAVRGGMGVVSAS